VSAASVLTRVARWSLLGPPCARPPISSAACALLALAARSDGVTREAYDRATDSGELVITLSLWAAIHALARPTSRSTDAR
jgi:hypothetical protein